MLFDYGMVIAKIQMLRIPTIFHHSVNILGKPKKKFTAINFNFESVCHLKKKTQRSQTLAHL